MNRIMRSIVVVVAISCLQAQAAFAGLIYFDSLYGVSTTKDVVYGTGQTSKGPMDLLLNIYQPVDIGLAPVPTNRPVVVIEDGGAWTSGSKDAGRVTTPAIYLAQRGYTTLTIDYRQIADSAIAGPGPWSNLQFGFPVTIFPTANVIRAGIEDFATAITWVKANAGSLGIDPNQVAIAGGSAGGVNALDLIYNGDTSAQPYSVKAVVALVSTMYGDYTKIVANSPPVFLLNSRTDGLIWYDPDVKNMIARFQQLGVYVEPWEQDLGFLTHGVEYDYKPYIPGVNETRDKDVLERMRDFLAYHFVPNGPVPVVVPEASSLALSVGAVALFGALRLRGRLRHAREASSSAPPNLG